MKWKEVIQVRSFNSKSKKEAFREAARMELPDRSDIPDSVELLDGNNLDTEICILLHWNSGPDHPEKSWLGSALAAAFSEFGWVRHSVWANRKVLTKKGEKRS